MSEFLGSRISLISKSDIRYSGILHEINSEESTVSLESVKSYGTEGRRGNPADEVAASEQVYEYIVFRGSDVKDLRIEQAPAAPKENQPPPVPDDPAIVGARTRPAGVIPPGPPNQVPGPPAGFGQNPYAPNFYPPPPGQWGRGGPGPGPGPGQGFNGMPYPPPPGWFPGQGFPPGGPGPWNNFGYPPGPQGPPGTPGQGMRTTPQQDNKPTPIGASADKQKPVGIPTVEAPTEPKAFGQPPQQPPSQLVAKDVAPTPPVESKPTAAEVKAAADSLTTKKPATNKPEPKSVPTGPRSSRITPAVPMPAALLSRSGPQAIAATASVKPAAEQSNGPPSAAALRDATQAAKAAVAVAMAKLDNPNATVGVVSPPAASNMMDNLAKKVNEMRVNATRGGPGRGRGRGGRGGIQSKVEVPDVDFDFQTANAKFNKQDLANEAVGSPPVRDAPNGHASKTPEPTDGAYNKTRSFFDNISSEAKERAENGGQKPGGREWRGEEQRKNMETFGQGSVDGGYRGGYRGRVRGRGRGNNRGRGGSRGRGGFQPTSSQ
ncbi:Scd6-like Sm domain-containing protein [Hypoxylon argillaceum]|nr:Scd6-like Sm domain-containing protein [Hypoxylon argillaceum]